MKTNKTKKRSQSNPSTQAEFDKFKALAERVLSVQNTEAGPKPKKKGRKKPRKK